MSQENEKRNFHGIIRAFEADIAAAGLHMHIDSQTRVAYAREIRAMSQELIRQAESNQITWSQAAAQAQETRNSVMEIMRNRSTPIGKAISERLKLEGRDLNDLIARKVQAMYGNNARFDGLSMQQRNAVYAEIVASAGRSNPAVTTKMQRAGTAGRGLIVLSVAFSVYNIAVAENKIETTIREATITGYGIVGSIAGGAMAGLACGPGAPVCVTVGAFVGGTLAALGVSVFW